MPATNRRKRYRVASFLFLGGSACSALRYRQRDGTVDTGPAGRVASGRGAPDGKAFSRPLRPPSRPAAAAAAANSTLMPIVLRVRQAVFAFELLSVRGTELSRAGTLALAVSSKSGIYLARRCF